MITFDVKLTQKVMFNFFLHHVYRKPIGAVGIAFGGINAVIGIRTIQLSGLKAALLSLGFAVILLIGMPLMLWFSAKKQEKAALAGKTLSYEIAENGIKIMQGEESQEILWTSFIKATDTKMSILMYLTANSVLIFPLEDLGENVAAVKEMIFANMDDKKVRIRK